LQSILGQAGGCSAEKDAGRMQAGCRQEDAALNIAY
jgi:hypothetical protein